MNPNKINVLIADDDCEILEICLKVQPLSNAHCEILTAKSVGDCIKSVADQQIDITFLDINFTTNGREGIGLIKTINRIRPKTSIIMLTSVDDPETIKECLKSGATDFISKGNKNVAARIFDHIKKLVDTQTQENQLVQESEQIAKQVGAVFRSPEMKRVFRDASLVRQNSGLNCLIRGPSGSGKELVARAIQDRASNRPWVSFNCACVPENLIESELFGYEKGAFTGATSSKRGFFDDANGGDLFLDEVACLSPKAQGSLLRVLQTGEYRRLGGTKNLKANVRVIAATNEDLDNQVKQGTFREDLLHRLNQYTIEIPALAKRRSDIKPIIENIIWRSGKPNVKICDDFVDFLSGLNWPGNVRELENAVKSMLAGTADGGFLSFADIPKQVLMYDENTADLDQDGAFKFSLPGILSIRNAVAQFETEYIHWVSSQVQGSLNHRALAKALAIPKTTLQRKLHAFELSKKSIMRRET